MRYVIAATNNLGQKRKLFQVMFARSDGSIFVNFPYYKHTNGVLSEVVYPGNQGPSADLSMVTRGNITSHLVKYAHHPDGRAHFSQDGKVLTRVKKQSVPLDAAEGHIFSVNIQGIEDFEQLTDKEEGTSTKKRTVLNFKFTKSFSALRIVGRIYPRFGFGSDNPAAPQVVGPKVPCQTPDGSILPAFLMSPPKGWPLDSLVLFLSCEKTPALDEGRDSVLSFIGGFDHPDIALDHAEDTYFLALQYPADDFSELQKQLDTIDLTSKQ